MIVKIQVVYLATQEDGTEYCVEPMPEILNGKNEAYFNAEMIGETLMIDEEVEGIEF